ncbi:uncharacterized protein LOC129593117 [Paramacrobiotus metropolitanus]|uniref:uncharacterized protein LOC129593117 n=1 Tax=Paramacrobiotus metropolitanus TaxID=2943436 RepID=UPI0024461C45|nr:uncharacterized protein LOC129593117 [Paramacrobiotus metropolitanus]
MNAISLVLVAIVTAAAAQEPGSPTTSIAAWKDGANIKVRAKIPHGLSLVISCPQPNPASPTAKNMPVQTVHLDSATYLAPTDGPAECSGDSVFSQMAVTCSMQKDTKCTITAEDPSEQEGCQERWLKVIYHCGNIGESTASLLGMIVNNMLDD